VVNSGVSIVSESIILTQHDNLYLPYDRSLEITEFTQMLPRVAGDLHSFVRLIIVNWRMPLQF